MMEQFSVKHYSGDERPTLKGNGFDGLELGKDREEAQRFVDFINGHHKDLAQLLNLVIEAGNATSVREMSLTVLDALEIAQRIKGAV